MILSVNIIGNGNVSGGGSYASGSAVTLTATPSSGWTFKDFVIDGASYASNPYSLTVGASDLSVSATFYVSFEDYLKGILAFDITEQALNSIRIKRNIDFGTDVKTLIIRTIELAQADALMWYATLPSSKTGAKDSDGGWSHQEATVSISSEDRKAFRSQAMAIYRKWGESNGLGTFKIVNL